MLLESFFLEQLEINVRVPNEVGTIQINTLRSTYGYEVGRHQTEPTRWRMEFRAEFLQLVDENTPAGYHVKSKIVGFLKLEDQLDEQKAAHAVRVNGVGILYGTLRGIVANSTGTFNLGVFYLPSIIPTDVVRNVEAKRIAEQAARQTSATASAAPITAQG